MIDRINKNEERLDSIILILKTIEEDLSIFKSNKKNIVLLNKYYGSKNWFKDKEAYENNKIEKIKAGVLSEDAVWNMNEELDSLIFEMKRIVDDYYSSKKE